MCIQIYEAAEKMTNQPIIFLSPRLVGRRFEQHGLPLDILKDFSVLDEMVKSVAKTLYLNDHPQRQRVPRNFLDDISLQIVNLEEGSTIAKIALVSLTASSELLTPPAQEYAEKARDCIIRTIEAAADGDSTYQSPLTQAQMLMFDRFGCRLQEGESIVFPVAQTEKHIEFTRDVRRTLVSKASSNGYQETVSIYGAMAEVDQDKKTFMLNTIEGQRLQIKKYEDDQANDVITAITYYSQGQKVLIHGIGKYSSTGRLESIEEVESITLLDTIDFGYQLAEIAALPAGWLNGTCVAFDKAQLQKLDNLFRENYTFEKDPWLYPAQDHTLFAEWESGSWRLSMEIDVSNFLGDFYAINIDNNRDFSQRFDLSNSENWKRLCLILGKPEEGFLE